MKKNSTETDEINFDIRLTWEEKQRRKQLTAERKFEKILKIPLWCVSWNFTRYCPTKGSPHPKNYLAYSDLLVLIVQYFNDVFRNPDFFGISFLLRYAQNSDAHQNISLIPYLGFQRVINPSFYQYSRYSEKHRSLRQSSLLICFPRFPNVFFAFTIKPIFVLLPHHHRVSHLYQHVKCVIRRTTIAGSQSTRISRFGNRAFLYEVWMVSENPPAVRLEL